MQSYEMNDDQRRIYIDSIQLHEAYMAALISYWAATSKSLLPMHYTLTRLVTAFFWNVVCWQPRTWMCYGIFGPNFDFSQLMRMSSQSLWLCRTPVLLLYIISGSAIKWIEMP
jgi:hypothetical protein